MLNSQQNSTQGRSACRSIAGLCAFLLGLFGSVSSSAASDPGVPITSGSSSANSSASGDAKTSAPLTSLTGTIAGDSALDQTLFANEESPGIVASFALVPGNTPPTANQVPPTPDAPAAASNLATDSASGSTDKDKKTDDDKLGDKDKKDEWNLLPKGWNFHAQTTIIDDFQPGFGICTPVPTAWARPATARARLPRIFFSAHRYGRVRSFTGICCCGRASA